MSEQPIKETSKMVWGATPAGWLYGQGYPKETQEFFTSVLKKRFTEECDWMFDVVKFERFKGKKVLEIGCGLGYDAYQFCKHGAMYMGIDLTPDNPRIAKNNLAFFGYEATVLEMDCEHLSLAEKFDYIFSFGVLHHTPNIQKALKNIYNALDDTGEAQLIVYYKRSIYYMLTVVLYDWILKMKFFKISLADRRSQIEYTTSGGKPLVNVYSKKELHTLCKNAGFKVIQTDIRKLVRDDLPGIPVFMKVYKYIPDSWLYFLSKRFGWYLSVRLVKA